MNRTHIKKIEKCTHCGQNTTVYRRNIRSNMIYCLQTLYRNFGMESAPQIKLSDKLNVLADFTKLKYWGLIEYAGNNEYRITYDGIDYLCGNKAMQKYKWVYNDQVQSGPMNEENPYIFVWDIKKSPISKEIALENSVNRSEYHMSKEAELF